MSHSVFLDASPFRRMPDGAAGEWQAFWNDERAEMEDASQGRDDGRGGRPVRSAPAAETAARRGDRPIDSAMDWLAVIVAVGCGLGVYLWSSSFIAGAIAFLAPAIGIPLGLMRLKR